jgi:hypothetical protein
MALKLCLVAGLLIGLWRPAEPVGYHLPVGTAERRNVNKVRRGC